MLKRLFSVLIMVIVFGFIFSSVSFAEIKLGNGIVTGMTISQVKESVDFKLSLYKHSRKLKVYQKEVTGTFYVLSECTGKLMYRLRMHKKQTTEKIEKNVASKFRKIKGKRFYRSEKDLGIKFHPYGKNNIFTIWVGSISRWNNFVRNCNSSMNLFPED